MLSTASNARIEAVAQPNSSLNWLQLYVMRERSIAEQMVRRARLAGYGALVLTVDVPVSGYRERDVRNGFRLPKDLVLIFKNLLYLNGFANALAPGTNLFDEIEPVFGYFLSRYPTELGEILALIDD